MEALPIIALLGWMATINAQVTLMSTWPAGRGTLGGARGYFKFSNLYFGTCTVSLPYPVALFLGENFDIVPNRSDSQRGRYVLVAPFQDYDEDTFNFIVNFYPGRSFRGSDIEVVCDSSKEAMIGIGSFPSSLSQNQVFTHIWYPKLRRKSELTIFFPDAVADFRAYGIGNVVRRGVNMYTLSEFYLDQNEVWFQFRYASRRKFDASEVTVTEQYYGY